uniref:Uncharacterized protein n=1 Tax=Nelumbo nucifera TaxID=4432 RepID=A0A822YVW5_NELNU|nr:TPA_asm: hypothetical protein HUJ06_006913 [Nelumbo nucifera]
MVHQRPTTGRADEASNHRKGLNAVSFPICHGRRALWILFHFLEKEDGE